jgi:hypothetical protein
MGRKLYQRTELRPHQRATHQSQLQLHQAQCRYSSIQLGKEDIEREIFNAGIIDPTKAVQLGLIDGVRNIDQ